MATTDPTEIRLTPFIFGKLLALAWAEEHGQSVLPSREDITKALLEQPLPAEVASVLHVDTRGDGKRIQEFTEYVAAAQEAGLLRRMNPSYVVGEIVVDRLTAKHLMGAYSHQFAKTVSWLRSCISTVQ